MKEVRCEYRGRQYSVRDDGSIFRHAKENHKPTKLDNTWTFGKKDDRSGYMLHGTVRVHQVVATAFHGAPADPNMVVDHKDTNRCNNRPENLVWVTRLENVLNNPFTRKKIVFRCGSIEAFLKNPSILRELAGDPNTKWMRNVSKEEAAKCYKNMKRWEAEDKEIDRRFDETHPRIEIGEWIYGSLSHDEEPEYENPYELKDSLTPGAKQLNWKTPCEFLLLPSMPSDNPLADYLANLKEGAIFCRNAYSESPIIKSDLSEDGKCLAVLCALENSATISALTVVRYEEGAFIHENIRSFLTEKGAEKYYTEALGRSWTGGGVLEDCC